MAYWLYKSEPSSWSWDMQKAAGRQGTEWTGVRNYAARNNMRAMALGDKGFFYHSNEGLEIVGITEVCALSHPDPTAAGDPKWDCVSIRAVCGLPEPVSLKEIKADPVFAKMALVTSMRLSVQPVTEAEYLEICRRGGLDEPPL